MSYNSEAIVMDKNGNMKFCIFPGYDHVFRYLLSDISEENNCKIFQNLYRRDFAKKIWGRLDRHPTIRLYASEFIANVLTPFMIMPTNIDKNTVFVFSNIGIQFFSTRLLKKLRNKGVKLVVYFLDDATNVNSTIALEKMKEIKFDLVFTFDKENALDYNFEYMHSMYSKLPVLNCEKKYIASFIGSDKGRAHIIKSIYEKLSKEIDEKDLFFSVYSTSKEFENKYADKMMVNKSIDYLEVVNITNQSNCIIDIVLGEQSGLSLRAYEAVVYNKKLITNNKSILKFKYYNPKFMLYCEDLNNIDVNFLKEATIVDYGYKGDFSPVHFLEKIYEKLNEKD